MLFKAPTVRYSDGTTVWGRGFAGQRVQRMDGNVLATDNQFYGGMIGGDRAAGAHLRLRGFESAGLIEASFKEAIDIIAASRELPEHTRRHWTTSLRQFGRAVDRPLEAIPAR